MLAALNLLDSRRQVRQLKQKLANTEKRGKMKASKIGQIRGRINDLEKEAHIGSLSGALAKHVRKWVAAIPAHKLAFYALVMPREPWQELADLVHLNPQTDFQSLGARPGVPSAPKVVASTSASKSEEKVAKEEAPKPATKDKPAPAPKAAPAPKVAPAESAASPAPAPGKKKKGAKGKKAKAVPASASAPAKPEPVVAKPAVPVVKPKFSEKALKKHPPGRGTFLNLVFGEEPPDDSIFTACQNVSINNIQELCTRYEVPYSFIRLHVKPIPDDVKARIARYMQIDHLIWYYEELANPEVDRVLLERLQNGEQPQFGYGKLMERLLYCNLLFLLLFLLYSPYCKCPLRSISPSYC